MSDFRIVVFLTTNMNKNKTLKRTNEELEKVFSRELLAIIEPEDFVFISIFELRAMTDGVTLEDLKQAADVINKYAA